MLKRLATYFRNLMSRKLFKVIERYSRGRVLDVGGWDFYRYVSKKKFPIESWLNLDIEINRINKIKDNVYKSIVCDGCDLSFANNTFDVVLNIQVLEHDMNPVRMVEEIARVLKPDGHAIFLIPQTSSIHLIPQCYYNFTIYWIKKALQQSKMEVRETYYLGGTWTTIAYKMLYVHLQALRINGWSSPEFKRNFAFYLLYPLMLLYTVISLPIIAVLSLGDLKEDATNHLIVAKKTVN
jgi:SAM-dependent methyltransferase